MSIRELPKIDIGGTDFYLDLRLNEFRQVENFMNRISLDEIYETATGYGILYDPLSKNFFKGDGEEYHQRKDLMNVQLPSLEQMDPVGFKSLVNGWKENNPILTALIEAMPVRRENDTKSIGQLIKDYQPRLLEKNRNNPSKVLRQ
jgi:hypothetical protein